MQGEKGMVVGMSLYSQIREAYVSGKSIRSIAKRLGISRQTVKKYCEGTTMPGVRKDYLRAPSVITPEIEKFIRTCLENDKEEGLKKQTHTAKRIYRIPDEANLKILSDFYKVYPQYILGETDYQNYWDKYNSEHQEELQDYKAHSPIEAFTELNNKIMIS